jgi:glutathione peroxidase-family protein
MVNLKNFLVFCFVILSVSVRAQVQPNITDSRLDFSLPGLKGDSIRLSSMKGKVFLLDFWASWCVPCRFSNKQLVKLYAKYKDKGFEILGVSLDDNKNAWKKAVNKDKISWLQINDNGGWDALSAIKWNINAIPASFLIDKDGNVVAIDPEKQELENKIRQLLGL